MKIEKLTGVSLKTGKPRVGVKATMKEAEYQRMCDESQGLCLMCGEIADGVEPDARRYSCDACNQSGVYGAEECLLFGRIVLT